MSPKIAFGLLILCCALLGLGGAKQLQGNSRSNTRTRIAETTAGECRCPCDGGANSKEGSGGSGGPRGPGGSGGAGGAEGSNKNQNMVSAYEKVRSRNG